MLFDQKSPALTVPVVDGVDKIFIQHTTYGHCDLLTESAQGRFSENILETLVLSVKGSKCIVGCVTFFFVKSQIDKNLEPEGKGPGNRGSGVITVTAQNGAVK